MADGERQPASLVDQMTRDLECPICFEEKQLRMLPCQHACCLQCIKTTYKKFRDQLDQSDRFPKCPTCTHELTKEPEEYSVCVWTECFRENLVKLSKALERDRCQINSCSRNAVKLCSLCNMFLCYCHGRDGGCEGGEDNHETEDIDVLADESREVLELWKISKQRKISQLTEQKEDSVKKMRNAVGTLKLVNDDGLCQLLGRQAEVMIEHHRKMKQVSQLLDHDQNTLKSISGYEIENYHSDIKLITVVKALNFYDLTQKRTLGQQHTVIQDVHCYDVNIMNDGNIMVCSGDSLLVLDRVTKEIIRQVASGFAIMAVSSFIDGFLICLCNKDRTNAHVAHLDQNLEEVRRWKSGESAVDMAVCSDKVYVSRQNDPDIEVFDLQTSAKLPSILRNGSSAALATYPPNSLIILDHQYDSVKKYKLRNDNWTIAWSTRVIKPWEVLVDDHGLIWVRSNRNDCITVLSRKGKAIQEIKDDRVTKLGEVCGMLVHGNKLWLASHDKGLGYFDILQV